jgi:hypothetical protein
MGRSWLRTRSGDIRDFGLVDYPSDASSSDDFNLFNINKNLLGGVGGAFALRKYFYYSGTVVNGTRQEISPLGGYDSVVMAVDAYDSGGNSFGATPAPLLINNIVIALEGPIVIAGNSNTPTVGILVAQYSTQYTYLGNPLTQYVISKPSAYYGAEFPTSGWQDSGGNSAYDPTPHGESTAILTAPPGVLGLVADDHFDQTTYPNKGKRGRDAIANGGLFWGSEDSYDQLRTAVFVTGSSGSNRTFNCYFSVFVTGWILPQYQF